MTHISLDEHNQALEHNLIHFVDSIDNMIVNYQEILKKSLSDIFDNLKIAPTSFIFKNDYCILNEEGDLLSVVPYTNYSVSWDKNPVILLDPNDTEIYHYPSMVMKFNINNSQYITCLNTLVDLEYNMSNTISLIYSIFNKLNVQQTYKILPINLRYLLPTDPEEQLNDISPISLKELSTEEQVDLPYRLIEQYDSNIFNKLVLYSNMQLLLKS